MKKSIFKRRVFYLIILVAALLFLLGLLAFKPNLSTQTINWVNTVLHPDEYNNGEGDYSNLSREEVVELYNQYLVDGLKYKASGDAGNKEDYDEAIKSFKKAIDLTERKFWVPVVNVANLYKAIGDYGQSEDYYNEALRISNYSEQTLYLAKIDLYRYYLEAEDDKVIDIFVEALDRVIIDRNNLIVSYAAFLRDTGHYEDAIEQYELLSQAYPDNQAYKDQIQVLRNK